MKTVRRANERTYWHGQGATWLNTHDKPHLRRKIRRARVSVISTDRVIQLRPAGPRPELSGRLSRKPGNAGASRPAIQWSPAAPGEHADNGSQSRDQPTSRSAVVIALEKLGLRYGRPISASTPQGGSRALRADPHFVRPPRQQCHCL